MPSRFRRRLTYANVMSTIAVFLALGGSAMAAYVVNSNNDIGPGTVAGAKPPSGAHSNIIAGSIGTSDLASGSVTSAQIAANAVTGTRTKNGTLTGVDMANDTLTGTQIDESTLGTVPDASKLGGIAADGFQQTVTGTCPAGGGIGGVFDDGSVSCNDNSVLPGYTDVAIGAISLAAHSCAKIDNVGWGQIAVGDTAIIVPDAATWPAGLIYMPLRADKAGIIAFDACNPTAATVASPNNENVSLWAVKLTP